MCAAKHCWLVLQTKVRDVKYCRDILKLASLGADGTVKLWDPNLSPVQSVSFAHTANVLFNGTVKLRDPNLLPVQSVSRSFAVRPVFAHTAHVLFKLTLQGDSARPSCMQTCSDTQPEQYALQPKAEAGRTWYVAPAANVFCNAVQMKLLHDKELVCMAMTGNLVAVGSQSHVSLLDPRIAQPTIRALDSIDPGQVKAVQWGKYEAELWALHTTGTLAAFLLSLVAIFM